MAARAVGKEIDFEIAGGDVQLDKSLCDAMADPLLHLLRNAVAHGIETALERAAAGKPTRGRISLEALSVEGAAEGGVRLLLSDDGRGVDTQLVAQAARERGLLSRATELSSDEALRLIFTPGFSTAASVSNVSGRGVGLDVVARSVEQLGGQIRVRSRPGAGTTFELFLDLKKIES
jgi:two-component system chemotaxis sensor kinase CheA